MAPGGFRVGIVGAGDRTLTSHLCAWKKIAGVTIAGIADSDPFRARKVAETFGIPFSTGSAEALFDLDLQAVDLCASYHLATAAVERSLPVLSAKSPAPTASELRQIGELAERNGVILMTGKPHRFGTQAQTFRRWIKEAGSIGQPYHARVRSVQQSPAVGTIPEINPDALDLCLWLLDFPRPLRVTGVTRENFAKGWKNPDEWGRGRFNIKSFTAGFIHFEKGLTLVFESVAELEHRAAAEVSSCDIFGTHGSIQWPSGEYDAVRSRSYLHGQLEDTPSPAILDAAEVRAFYDAVTQRLPSPVSWKECERIMLILEAIKTSQREGKEIRF